MLLMMYSLKAFTIAGTSTTPDVFFNEKNDTLYLQGVSEPVDAKGFYHPIIKWMSESSYAKQKMTVCFRFEYFNYASVKAILSLVLAIDDLFADGCQTEIIWEYETEDVELKEIGLEYASLIKCPVVLREYS